MTELTPLRFTFFYDALELSSITLHPYREHKIEVCDHTNVA